MIAGDTAGLGLLCSPYSWIGVTKTAEGTSLQMLIASGASGRRGGAAATPPAPVVGATNPPAHVWLRVGCNFDSNIAVFSWSVDGKAFSNLGKWSIPGFQLQTFQGVRPALFNFNITGQPGGYADFDNYAVMQPRARGIEREIPAGKTITLTSGADGSLLSADTTANTLINVAAEGANAKNTQFQVIDTGLGRVALKAANGKFVSVDGEQVVLKDLAGAKPGESESFQWVNLMRGDTMLMALTTHRYFATKPNTPGPVTVTSLGPTAARKGGECFKWKAID